MTNAALIRKYDLQERVPEQSDHDYCDLPNVVSISEYKEAAISYIGGFVAKTVEKKLPCRECCNVLDLETTLHLFPIPAVKRSG